MNLFAALDDQPPALLSAQLLTMGVFLTAYLFAVTGLLGTKGRLRAAGVAVQMHAGGGSIKSQFKKADASGARHALVFGADELARGEVTLKPLRDAAAGQAARRLDAVAAWAHELRTA